MTLRQNRYGILIVFLFISIGISVYFVYNLKKDTFINYPQPVDPTKVIRSDTGAVDAKNAYAQILMYLQENPDKSSAFIEDIQEKFFRGDCKIKSQIDFEDLAKMNPDVFS
jgi:hypothetical protein